MSTPRSLMQFAAARGVEHVDAQCLLACALGRDRAWLVAHVDDALDGDAATRCETLLARRAGGEPVAYLTGRRGFWSIDLEITPATLIPRRETELLVEQALARIPSDRQVAVADLGTGSGAVALAIVRDRPRARVLATDLSNQALAVARRNAARLGCYNVDFACGDWCAALGEARFDVIVSNPPYVADGDPHLLEGDLPREPHMALASGRDGLDAIRHIVAGAREHIVVGGWLLLEHGWQQGAAVRALLRADGYAETFTARDLEHRERVSGGRAPAA